MNTVLVANKKGGCGKTSIAINLAVALANSGQTVALADADSQKSSLRWLKQRSSGLAPILPVDWRDDNDIGFIPKKLKLGKKDWLVIDAPGSLSGEKAEQLISQSKAVIIPVLPSIFDVDSTKQFLKSIKDIKRIRKGKVEIYLLANRIKIQNNHLQKLQYFFEDIGQQPIAWISERAIYPQLAEQGAGLFDYQQKRFKDIQQQWYPLLQALQVMDIDLDKLQVDERAFYHQSFVCQSSNQVREAQGMTLNMADKVEENETQKTVKSNSSWYE